MGRERSRRVSVAFGNGALTYPTNGVPLPTAAYFGLNSIKNIFFDFAVNGYLYRYDLTNHKLLIYQTATLTPAGTNSAPAFTGTPASFTGGIRKFSWQNVKGADADVAGSMTTDQNAGCTNDDMIDTFAAIAGGAWTYSENLEIDVPRNIVLSIYNDSGGPLNMEEAAFTATITGTFRGAAQTDVITETFTAGNKAIANTKFRWKAGVKPFDHITDIVVTGLTANQNNLKIGIGPGRLLGVPVEPKDNVIGDFVKIVKNSADIAGVAYNDTNKTLDLGALADNDDLDIEVEVASIGESYTPAGSVAAPTFTGAATTAAALAEVSASFTPAAQTHYALAIGR